jgi:hypothetical protein
LGNVFQAKEDGDAWPTLVLDINVPAMPLTRPNRRDADAPSYDIPSKNGDNPAHNRGMRCDFAEARQICVHNLVPGALAECVILALRPQEFSVN